MRRRPDIRRPLPHLDLPPGETCGLKRRIAEGLGIGDNAEVGAKHLRTLISADEIAARVAALGREIEADYAGEPGRPPLRLIGVLKGACFFVADLARAIESEVSLDFIRVRSYEERTQSSGQFVLTKDLDDEISGLDVLLVEDIVDTGLTVHRLLETFGRRGPRSLHVVTLLDKPSRRVQPVELRYVGFEIPDHFVVGYGLDYAGHYRNRTDICVLEEGQGA